MRLLPPWFDVDTAADLARLREAVRDGVVARLWLDRPEQHNALSAELVTELTVTLHALANGASGGDGVYTYAGASTFPANSFNASNYWVDVVFSPIIGGPDDFSISASPATVTLQPGAGGRVVGRYAPGSEPYGYIQRAVRALHPFRVRLDQLGR